MHVFDNFPVSPFGTYGSWGQAPLSVDPVGTLDGSPRFAPSNVDPLLLASSYVDPMLHTVASADSNTNQQPINIAASVPATAANLNKFPYFLEKLEPPFISHFDRDNWIRMRQYLADLGSRDSVVASAIIAVQALYEAEENGWDTTNAIALYYAAKASHATLLEELDPGFEPTIMAAFLLLCFEIVAQQETVSVTMKPEGAFVDKLEQWAKLRPWPPVACRVETWLKLLHVKALHLGGRGLMCAKVSRLLSYDSGPTPSLILLDQHPSPPSILYDSLSSQLFEFYMQTQKIGASLCGLNRHHRSRGSLMDETEVDQVAQNIRKQLQSLYQQRPSVLQLRPEELRSVIPAPFANSLATLIDLCNAAYHIEIVDLGRAHGQWLTPTPEAQEAMQHVRHIVDENFTQNSGAVSPGFMWPIFFYALEADEEGGKWAVRMLQQIRRPTCHSDFFALFLEAVLDQQRQKGERVDCRYLCIEKFGIPPPFI
ncbi:hypothetical protein G647_03225 [Cladophialophora carrionii CBS 160.54]|uniref:Uncharacterized protein n=1 Tax=Cladophialophora carrionii CBS 160.54 TaxID=1279043 RepID=V9DJG2_9EURO|nr:uncharacterized protein G647_03225 [Cladophialophora carrionii CBS 160.54]ETI26448.1 hypothetical protein G647_03225 [Cladophialophora carrionii CBS 160.54]